MKKVFYSSLAVSVALVPAMALAQSGAYNSINTFLNFVASWIPRLTGIVFGLAILAFLWGLFKFILAAGNEDKRKEGKSIMVWGLVAIFVMASVFGIVRLAQRTFEVDNNSPLSPPRVNI